MQNNEGWNHVEDTNRDLKLRRIRDLNDQFRRTGQGGRQVITPGIQAMGLIAILSLRQQVAAFDAFTEDNDPYGEHDFGSLKFLGKTVFWKIDYYNRTFTEGSPNPADPEVTTRVLTVLLASEY